MQHSSPLTPNATATVVIEGLAIAIHNSATGKWEVGFLRQDDHFPRLVIVELDAAGNEVSVPQTTILAAGEKVYLTAANAVPPSNWRYENGSRFVRATHPDTQDARWMLDMEGAELHNSPVTWQNGTLETNFLTIEHCIFYTAKVSPDPLQLQKVDSGSVQSPTTLGKIGVAFGADIECNGAVEINIQGAERKTITLTPKAGLRYEIYFDNTCFTGTPPVESDFKHYYDKISGNPVKFNLMPTGNAPPVGGNKNPPCSAVECGKSAELPLFFK